MGMSDLISATGAAARAADALLRAVGGRTVMLRVPSPAVPADITEQLGIAVPMFQDLPLAPVVYRKARATHDWRKVGEMGASGIGHCGGDFGRITGICICECSVCDRVRGFVRR